MKDTTKRSRLTQPYHVYLAAYDAEVTLPAGTEFDLFVKARGEYYGEYDHPKYGRFMVQTPDAIDA